MKIRIAVLGFCIIWAISAFGQMVSSRMGPEGQITTTMTFGNNGIPHMIPPISGAPYSATQINLRIQMLQDGTKVTSDGPVMHLYRDEAGRTCTERPLQLPSNMKNPPYIAEINDTVANQKIVLDPVNRVAHRIAMPPAPEKLRDVLEANLSGAPFQVVGDSDEPGSNNRFESTTEQLGQKAIDGLVVVGSRISQIIPVGAMRNDRPFTITTEFWVSPELKMPVYTKTSDPRLGEMLIILKDISRAEPDAAFFQIPKDYQVIDETGPLTISVTIPQK